ncbi:Pfam:DUF3661 [Teratosphaeria destructans]|uniref:peptidylprolyl isomerase n=1 Tax=Teratosphaeria destructans TaxID=418781 RepID=A0A9W7W0L5_9PEZI|nr:Pfam:DUF3661 [Teratosphaeria destructans]
MRSFTLLPAPLLALVAPALAHETTTTGSGLQIEYTESVACPRRTQNGDKLSVHYRGTLQSTGEEFDASFNRGKPFHFTLGAHMVIAGWDEGLLDMCPGDRRRLTIPPELGYGDSGSGPIPGGATLVFETYLVDIVGVKQEGITPATASVSSTEDGAFSIETAPPEPPAGFGAGHEEDTQQSPDHDQQAMETPEKQAECHLLGPFALLVQGALGAFAILSLVWKRYRETPKRPWKVWFFDVSKQVVGSMLTHVLNLAMSMLGGVEMVNAAKQAGVESAKGDPDRRMPNPCSYYLLNLGIDTTLGIPVLYILLKILHAAFLRTPLARPTESIKSGHYGQPPKYQWWLKQSLIYFIGLVGMKLFVFFLFAAMPWLPWVGDWALRWTKGNEALEVTFAMFIFPLAMNAIQYWVIDNFIMDKKKELDDKGYEAVQGDEEDGDNGWDHGDEDDASSVTHLNADVQGKQQVEDEPLKEVNPTPIPDHPHGFEQGSRTNTPVKKDD